MDVQETPLYEKADEDENTKRRREEHEINIRRWEFGDDAPEMHKNAKKQRLMEEQEQSLHDDDDVEAEAPIY